MSAKNEPHNSGTKKKADDGKIVIGGDVTGNDIVIGNNNVVTKQTFIQRITNIFKSDAETLEQRNRRILLNHVENAWIKGVLDASLHGAALLDLGIKQDPEAVTQYPWTLKKESTDETLPAGTSMLDIFDSIGMGRSLLILGAPGSGKTTMLLELARGLIARAREDVTQPIPMVFNLASWTEKLSLADWLAQELNNLYSVPRKTAPDWVKGNKLLLLLDGLDEVRQESRAKCVEAINAFRKQNGLTSLAVCSRSQDYADLNAKLSFEGAIEVQPLTQKQITEFFNRFGKEMAGIKQVLKKDSALFEMAETPLFLSIIMMAYRDKRDVDIWVSKDKKTQRKHLFDTYIENMFERPRTKNAPFQEQDVLHWLSWLSIKMIKHNQVPYLFENMQPLWLSQKKQWVYKLAIELIEALIFALIFSTLFVPIFGPILGLAFWPFILICGLAIGFVGALFGKLRKIEMVDVVTWNWRQKRKELGIGLILGLIVGLLIGLNNWWKRGLVVGISSGIISILFIAVSSGMIVKSISQTTYPGQRISSSIKNSLFASLLFGLIWLLVRGPITMVFIGLSSGLIYGGNAVIEHCALRLILSINNLLPWRLIPFLDHCVDLIFLRRVGGGYIFVHRLLMEHFAERLNHD